MLTAQDLTQQLKKYPKEAEIAVIDDSLYIKIEGVTDKLKKKDEKELEEKTPAIGFAIPIEEEEYED